MYTYTHNSGTRCMEAHFCQLNTQKKSKLKLMKLYAYCESELW